MRSIYRRPCVDFEGLRNPVELWRAGGGHYHRPKRRKISAPAEVLPRWRAGIEAVVATPRVQGCILVWALYGNAPQRGAVPAVGTSGHGGACLPGRGDQDR